MSAKNHPSKAAAASFQIEVRLKPEFSDAEGAAAQSLLHGLGVAAAREVRKSLIYAVRGPYNSGQIQQAARELLCDSVTQEHRILSAAAVPPNGMSHWRVEVWLKDTVTDPVGETVAAALTEMGLPRPESVRVGSAYHVVGKCGRHQLEKAVARCLANPVIHRFTIAEALS